VPSGNASEQSDRPPSGNLTAYNAVLEGKYYFERGTETDTRTAIDRFTAATQLDPRYALAWSLESRAWTRLGANYIGLTHADETYAKARAAVNTALALAPDLAIAHMALGELLTFGDFDWRSAETEYRRALDLMPGDGNAKGGLGVVLATRGQLEKAIELTTQAIVADPLNKDWYYSLAAYLLVLNRLEEAERATRKGIELQPGAAGYYALLTMIYVQRRDATLALAAAQHEVPGEYWRDVALAMARQIGDDPAAAEASLKTLIEHYADTATYQVAQVYAIRKDADKTFEWLDRAWSNHDTGITYLLFDPFVLRYQYDPRFVAFCRKVGLPTPSEVKDQLKK
jgi:tetratricopeptide (TPR) repeat protein